MYNNIHESKNYQNIREIIEDFTEQFGENIAFTIKHKNGKEVSYEDITYNEFHSDVIGLAKSLIHMGLKDKRIAIIGKNRYEWVVSFCAITYGVGVAVPLDKGLPEQEIETSINRAKCDAIIFTEDNKDHMNELRTNGTCPTLKTFICMDDMQEFTKFHLLIEKGKDLKEEEEILKEAPKPEDLAEIVFTSGTTSLAKAVMLSQRNVGSNIYGLDCAETLYPTDTNFCLLPFHHTFGSSGILFVMSYGARSVFCDGLRYIQPNLCEYGVSVFIGVPLILESMHKKVMAEVKKQGKEKTFKFGKFVSNALMKVKVDVRRKLFKDVIAKLGKLRLIVSGAAALDPVVARDFYAMGITVVQGYGLTETAPVITGENDYEVRFGSIGHPLLGYEVKIDGKNEEGIGEICAKGDNVMMGYLDDEEATKEAIDSEGWFHTGDLGYIDKDGYVFITGRKKNVIVLKNGKNVYPEELELLINNLPYVAESMVFGWPEDDGDSTLTVKIVYNKEYVEKNYMDKSEEEFKELVWNDIKKINSTLTNYKHMKKLILTDEEMIKTTTSKVKRFQEIEKILKESK